MTKKDQPSDKTWLTLYKLMDELKKSAPWQWVNDYELICIQNPKTNEIGYCSIMGSLGIVLGINFYIGEAGLQAYFLLCNQDRIDVRKTYKIKCLAATFEDRKSISDKDANQIKSLGLSYRGKKAYPNFRKYEPFYYPWYLDKKDAEFLIILLEKTLEHVHRFNDDEVLINKYENDYYLLLKSSMKDNKIEWSEEFITLEEDYNFVDVKVPHLDEIKLKKISQNVKKLINSSWEIDVYVYSQAVQDKKGDIPVFITSLLILDSNSQMILTLPNVTKKPMDYEDFQKIVIKAFTDLKFLPERIYVRDIGIEKCLKPIMDYLRIDLILVNELPAVDFFSENLDNFGF